MNDISAMKPRVLSNNDKSLKKSPGAFAPGDTDTFHIEGYLSVFTTRALLSSPKVARKPPPRASSR